MSGEQLAVLRAVADIMGIVGSWPGVGALGIMVVGPWVAVLIIVLYQGKRFQSVVHMYEANAELLKWHEDLSRDLKDIVLMNTTAWQETHGEIRGARDDIKSNRFCPASRIEQSKQVGPQ